MLLKPQHPGAVRVAVIAGAVTLAALVSGCNYDAMNHSDRITLAAGNAVRANLERSTINPTKSSMYQTGGLGRNGNVIPSPAPAAAAPMP